MSKRSLPEPLQVLNAGVAEIKGGTAFQLLQSNMNAPEGEPVDDFYISGNSKRAVPVLCEHVAQWKTNKTFWIHDDAHACKVMHLSDIATSCKSTLLMAGAKFLGTEEVMGGECPRSIKDCSTLWEIEDFTPYCDASKITVCSKEAKANQRSAPEMRAAEKKRVASSSVKCNACGRPFSRRQGLNKHHRDGATARTYPSGISYPACKNGRLTGSKSAWRKKR